MDPQAAEILRQLTIICARLHVRMDAIERLLDEMEARRESQGASCRSARDYKRWAMAGSRRRDEDQRHARSLAATIGGIH